MGRKDQGLVRDNRKKQNVSPRSPAMQKLYNRSFSAVTSFQMDSVDEILLCFYELCSVESWIFMTINTRSSEECDNAHSKLQHTGKVNGGRGVILDCKVS